MRRIPNFQRRRSEDLRRICVMVVVLGATALVVQPQTSAVEPLVPEPQSSAGLRIVLPEPTGGYAVGVTELHLVDHRRADPWIPDRRRELMVSVWYPTGRHTAAFAPYMPPRAGEAAAAQVTSLLGLMPEQIDFAGALTHARVGVPVLGGHHPVVLYSPGRRVSRLSATHQAEELASQGYVVVAIDHTGEAVVEFPGGRLVEVWMPGRNTPAMVRKATAARTADTRFVLDQLAVLQRGGNPDADHRVLPGGLAGALDLTRTGMFGFSLGGMTAGEVMLRDRRVDAGANLDGTLTYDYPIQTHLSDVAQQGLDRPFLLMGAMNHHHRTGDRSWTLFWQRQRGWKLDLNIPTAKHPGFADYQFILPQLTAKFDIPPSQVKTLIGTVDPARSMAAQRAYLTAFFDQFLRQQPQPLLDRESPLHPDVKFIR
jgi:dienelactone hydrolase